MIETKCNSRKSRPVFLKSVTLNIKLSVNY